MIVDHDVIKKLLQEAADTYILPRFQALEDDDISTKTGPRDLVTKADVEAEAFLERVLPDLYPGSLVVGEEGVSRGDKVLDTLAEEGAMIWVVDPVDGTFNFVQGKDDFGVMLACIVDGQVQHSWIYHPRSGAMYETERGSGAYKDGARLNVSTQSDMAQMTGHVSRRFFPEDMQETIHERMQALKSWIPIGAAAHEYSRIADGRSDVSIYSRLKPWDHLPGSLLVEEAGGYIAKWDGQPYTLKDQYAGLIVTNSKENWQKLHSFMFDGLL